MTVGHISGSLPPRELQSTDNIRDMTHIDHLIETLLQCICNYAMIYKINDAINFIKLNFAGIEFRLIVHFIANFH